MKRCHKCGQEWAGGKRVPGVKEFCEGCTAYLHCCLNCRHYDERAHNKCHIPTTDWVGDRAGANFCDEFEFVDTEAPGQDDGRGDARDAFEGLFGGGTGPAKKGGREDFDKLFGE